MSMELDHEECSTLSACEIAEKWMKRATIAESKVAEQATTIAELTGLAQGADAKANAFQSTILQQTSTIAEYGLKICGLERELEDLRCPLVPKSHSVEKMAQHYCPYWAKVADQAATIERLRRSQGLAERLIIEQAALLEQMRKALENARGELLELNYNMNSGVVLQIEAALSKDSQP